MQWAPLSFNVQGQDPSHGILGAVHLYPEWAIVTGEVENQLGAQVLLQSVKGFLLLQTPGKWLVSSELVEGSGNLGEVLDEPSVVIEEPNGCP